MPYANRRANLICAWTVSGLPTIFSCGRPASRFELPNALRILARSVVEHLPIGCQRPLEILDVQARERDVGCVVVLNLRHFTHGSFVMLTKDLRRPSRTFPFKAKHTERVHTQIDCAPERLAIDIGHAFAQQLVGVLATRSTREDAKRRTLALRARGMGR